MISALSLFHPRLLPGTQLQLTEQEHCETRTLMSVLLSCLFPDATPPTIDGISRFPCLQRNEPIPRGTHVIWELKLAYDSTMNAVIMTQSISRVFSPASETTNTIGYWETVFD